MSDPDPSFIAGLARVRAAAGALIRDEAGRVLIVQITDHLAPEWSSRGIWSVARSAAVGGIRGGGGGGGHGGGADGDEGGQEGCSDTTTHGNSLAVGN
ncbi:hypothetical protein Skr01_23140 [Sphaerisporangium krabiense]|nr:hypothetical protein Skr01_23140 [Sphaerisporangium krabiense]